MADKKNGNNNLGLAVAGVALTAVGAAAGAILANKELRGKLGKKTEDALKVVSQLAIQAEKGAEKGLGMLQDKAEEMVQEVKPSKKAPKKAGSKHKSK